MRCSTRPAIAAILLASIGAFVSVTPTIAVGQERSGASPSTRSLYLELIRQARADNKPRAALAYLDDFDSQHPDDLEAKLLRINCLLDVGDVEAAAQLVSALPKGRKEASLGVEVMRGHVLAAQKQWGEAVLHYEAALVSIPADPFLHNALGYAYLRAGNPHQAVEVLRTARELAPGSNIVRNNFILALVLNGDLANARGEMDAWDAHEDRALLESRVFSEASRIAESLASVGRQQHNLETEH